MLMQGLSLEQAPPYKIPLFFYMSGVLYLVFFCVALLMFFADLDTRYSYEALLITHIFTLGFLLHIMMGTLFQMLPVIVGVSYSKIDLNAKIIYILLSLANISIFIYLFDKSDFLVYIFGLLSFVVVIYFGIFSVFTLLKAVEKNSIVQVFFIAQIFLILGAVLGLLTLLNYGGSRFGISLGTSHIITMIFGWVVLLMSGVALKVIPMFYVTKEYPLFCKKYFSKFIAFMIVLFLIANIYELWNLVYSIKIALALALIAFSLMTILRLGRRKRARRDTTVLLWYFSMLNLFVGSLVWIYALVYDLNIDRVLSLIFGVGAFYALINGMLYKIIPFLTWFHLSSKMIYEAEMGLVIPVKRMQLQFYFFVLAYVGFLFSFAFTSLFVVAGVFFLCSSLLLLYNIILGYKYHQKMAQKI